MRKKLLIPFLSLVFVLAILEGVHAGSGIYDGGIYVGGAPYSMNNTSGYSGTLFNTYNFGNQTNFFITEARAYTFKDANGNVCSVSFNYRVYKVGQTPGTFTSVNLPFNSNLGGGNQLWLNNTLNVNLLSGLELGATYKLEIYYEYKGSTTSSSACDPGSTGFLSNSSNNYIATFTYGNVYWWIGGNTSNAINTTSAWSTTRGGSAVGSLTFDANTVLNFDGSCMSTSCTVTSGNITVTHGASAYTLGKILLSNNANVTYIPGVTNKSLTLSGGVGTDFDIPSGASWTSLGAAHSITINTGATASISGTYNIGTSSTVISDFQLLGTDAGSIAFNSNSTCLINDGSGIFPFGTSATAGIVTFASTSILKHYQSEDVFGGSGKTVLTFFSGSTYEFDGSTGSNLNLNKAHTSTRKYSNIVFNNSGAINSSGNFGSDISCDSFIVKSTCGGDVLMQNYSRLLSIGGNLSNHTTTRILSFVPSANGTSTINFDSARTHYILTNNAANGGINFGTTTSSRLVYVNITSSDIVILGSTSETGQIQLTSASSGVTYDHTIFTVKDGGTLDMGTNVIYGLSSTQGGKFVTELGSTVKTKHTGGLSTTASTGAVQTQAMIYSSGGNYTFNGTTAQNTGNFILSTTATAKTVHDLTIDNTAGVTLGPSVSDVTITNNGVSNGTLYLTNGIFTTNPSSVAITSSTGSVSRTNGWVYGNLQKYVGTSTSALTWEVGGANYYTPAIITFAGTSGTGSLTVKSTDGDHPNISTSTFNPSLTANRYWTFANSGITFTSYILNLSYNALDLDTYADPTVFAIGLYSGSWSYPTVSYISRTSGNWQASGLLIPTTGNSTAVQLGEQCAASTTVIWTGAAGSAGVGDWDNTGNWQCGSKPTSTSNVKIPNTTNKPEIKSAHAVANSVTIETSASLTMSGIYNLTISSNGYLINNQGATGFLSSSTADTLIFAGGTTSFLQGTTTLKNVRTSGAIDFGVGTSTVNGSFTINNNGYVSNSHPPIYTCAATLKYNTTGTFNRGSEWISGATTGQAGYPGNVQISNATAFNYGTATAATSICGYLTVDLNTSFNMGASTAPLTVPGNVTINGAFALSTASGGDLKIGGDYTVGAGTGPTGNGFPINNGRAIYFNGSVNQLVTKTGNGNLYIDRLILDKPNTSSGELKINPGTNIKIIATTSSSPGNQVLQLSNGDINLSGGDMTLDANGIATSINITVDGTSSGGTRRIYSNTGTGTFNIIDGTSTFLGGTASLTVTSNNSTKLKMDDGIDVTTQVGVDFGSSVTTINSTFTINQHGYVIGNSPSYGSSSTLVYNNGSGGYNRNMEWNTNSVDVVNGYGYPNNVIVKNGTPLNLNSGTYPAPRNIGCAGYLDIKSGSVDMNGMAFKLIVGTDLTITGTLSLSSAPFGDLEVGGSWTRTGTFNQNGRNVTFNNSTDGILTATGGQLFSNVYFTKSFGKKLTLASDIRVSTEAGFTSGILDLKTNGKFFILLSDASKTARVAQSSSSMVIDYGITDNVGQFIIQRYVPAKRAWRLMSPPIINGGGLHYINQAWQDQEIPASGYAPGYDYASGGSPSGDTVKASFATQITGGSTANGFDLSLENKASILKFNPSNSSTFNNSTGTWSAPANTNATNVYSERGWMLFVRGDRINYGQITNQYKTPLVTTLRPRGQINIGDVRVPSSGNLIGIQVVGNPYASSIDFNKVTKAGNVNTTKYWVWDPQVGGINGRGAFVALTWNSGTSTFDRSIPLSTGTSTYDNRYIPSGAAIMVDFGASPGGNITFNENNKDNTNTTTAFRPSRNIRTTLNSIEPDGSTFVTDGVLNLFNENYDTAVNNDDVMKLTNIEGENFSIKKNGVLLSIEKTRLPKATDTIFYNWSKVKVRDYQLEITTDSLQNEWLDLYLEDKYKKTQTQINLNDTTRYNFNIVREDSGTFKADRLRLIMKYNPPSFNSLKAWQKYSDVSLLWSLNDTKGINQFIIERSLDGINFVEIGTLSAFDGTEKVFFNWLDNNPSVGNNFYRVKGNANGKYIYSEIARVEIAKPELSIYPNPVTNGEVGLQLTNMPKGTYGISLLNNLGQIIVRKQIKHLGGNESAKIPLGTVKTKGVYQLQVVKPDNTKETLRIVY